MRRCLDLAKQGRGLTGMNPLVGAVLVRDENILAEGWYRGVGTDHAEVDMIKKLDQTIQPKDRLYVNLEPCNHTGETPPCTQAIIDHGITHVVVGMVDPDKRVAGQGIAALREAGVAVTGPICRAECERLNRGFISVRTKGRPYITLKRAQTRKGNVSHSDGSKLCITSNEQNIWSHTYLRTTHDAIVVGVGTVLSDNPQLTIRLNTNIDQNFPQPKKIILDPHLKTPLEAKALGVDVIIVTDTKALGELKERQLKAKGATILAVPMVNNHFDWAALWQALSTSQFPISTLLVEGGSITWAAFAESSLVDESITLVGDI